ncbi:hypothetical protein [Ancylomarina longa]|uniref:DUF4382 domain-containing protein n=1 Tax=Ancylomarina longa TaxID=2487017 RepID=A0A434AXK3_9BACT|nr:hypothetical protein [Ancylomarina longa]RUT79283.1 hypothetical protein DLK05_03410 [Ancylomarina longa]
MYHNWIKVLGFSLSVICMSNSCSSGADPDAIILDVFSVPAENALQIQNAANDLSMDVNGILMNNLDFDQDTIKENTSDCLKALIYRNTLTSKLDSLVLDYGTSYCSSNGGRFKGKVIVIPENENLKLFTITLSDFFASGYEIKGNVAFEITGDVVGKDFSITSSDLTFILENTEIAFNILGLDSKYVFLNDEEDDVSYIDDVFKFTTSISGETPDGASFSFDSDDGLIYAYLCKQIIGGEALFVLSNVGEATFEFGAGDPVDDCDNIVNLIGETANIEFQL